MSGSQFSSNLPLREKINAHRAGRPLGIYSVCSSHPEVLRAAMQLHKQSEETLLIEATCNQVNPEGGYTGMTPEGFTAYVRTLAKEENFPTERIILGGDHLGPNPWRSRPAEEALLKSERMVREYASAGFTKIHLDASMACKGEAPLSVTEIAERTAALCAACEQATADHPAADKPLYVIGTEVPLPGGLTAYEAGQPHVTRVNDVAETLEVHREVFLRHGLADALDRVIAVVVSPGVEFGDQDIFPFEREKTGELTAFIEGQDGLIYEAHSTDYQSPLALRQMVSDHFAILKVGPALTFALREALFNLAAIEDELPSIHPEQRSHLIETLMEVMQSNPIHWREHYLGSTAEVKFALKYSFSDRVRYYWDYAHVQSALSCLFDNLGQRNIPLALISQFFPTLYAAVYDGNIPPTPRCLIRHSIMRVMEGYLKACA